MNVLAQGLLLAPQILLSVFNPPPDVTALNITNIRCHVADYELMLPVTKNAKFQVFRDGRLVTGSQYKALGMEFSGWDEGGAGTLEWRFGRPGEYLRVDLYKDDENANGMYEGPAMEEGAGDNLECIVDRKS